MKFGGRFSLKAARPSSPSAVEVSLPDVSLSLTADRGVFSSERLDAGTKFLLLEAPPLGRNEMVLDLGCGWGPISCVAALRAPDAHVWAVDVNSRARDLTTTNAAAIEASDRVTVAAPDDIPADIRFTRIFSNPPIEEERASMTSAIPPEAMRRMSRYLPYSPGSVTTLQLLARIGLWGIDTEPRVYEEFPRDQITAFHDTVLRTPNGTRL